MLYFAEHWNLIASSLASDITQVGSWISFILFSVPLLDSFISYALIWLLQIHHPCVIHY